MKVLLKIIGAILLIVVLATIVLPVGYLAWRADQPIDLPQFKSLSYYQYLKWRKGAYHELAVEYKAAHPNAKMGGGLDMCFDVNTVVDLSLKLPLAGFYTLAGAYPNLVKFVAPEDREEIPKDVTLWSSLPALWNTYEKNVWNSAQHAPETSVAYCRLQPNIPTPAELQSMLARPAQGDCAICRGKKLNSKN